jgi:Rrf2 family protein
MLVNNRFAVAIQVLTLARCGHGASGGCPVTSEQMAELVNTNPVVVRRILGPLREAGLVTSQPGPGGGWRLTRPPGEITLRDVYRAIEGDRAFERPGHAAGADCPVGRCLSGVLTSCYREAEKALEAKLAQVTVADVIRSAQFEAAGGVAFDGSPFGKEVLLQVK